MTLVPTNESKRKIIKNNEEFWNKIRELTTSVTKNSDDYGEKYMKIKFNWDDKLHFMKITNNIHKLF